jgi:tRNA wybutosine-synthesizing protein 4
MDHSPSPPNNNDNDSVLLDPADRPVIATADDALSAKQATVAAGYYSDEYLQYFTHAPVRMMQPIIKRGTHARVACIDRAILSFSKLYPNSSQIVVLGAGMDTTFFKSVTWNISSMWFEVDHAFVIQKKNRLIQKHAKELQVSIQQQENGDCRLTRTFTCDTTTSTTCSCIAHDLRQSPTQLFEKLMTRGFKPNVPTLFLLECVQMYLPEDASRALLSQLTSTCGKYASVVIYDPIAQYDAFGQVMERHLVSAGMAATSLLQTRTLQHQLDKLTECGFEIAVGSDMWSAYHTVLTDEQRIKANMCEVLDELEEWKMLMQHYCLVVGSSIESGFCQVVGEQEATSSPMGFVKEQSCISTRQQEKPSI